MQEQSAEPSGGDDKGGGASPSPAQRYITVHLDATHRVELFESRHPDVQKFIREEARAYAAASLGEVCVLPSKADPSRVDGYYNIATSSLRRDETADTIQRSLPGDPNVPIPVFIIGWLGRDRSTEKGLGAELVYDAALRARDYGRVSWGLVLYAANRGLIEYYRSLHFEPARRTIKQLEKEGAGRESDRYYMYARYEDLLG